MMIMQEDEDNLNFALNRLNQWYQLKTSTGYGPRWCALHKIKNVKLILLENSS